MYRDSAFGETTLTVEELTGQAPRRLDHWLERTSRSSSRAERC
jgi:hypothetical protein